MIPGGVSITHPNVAPQGVIKPSLDEYLAQFGPPEPRQALFWLRELASAIDFAHSRGVVHGSLDPTHIGVIPSGHLKIFGFGLHPAANADRDLAEFAALAESWLGVAALRGLRMGASASDFVDAIAARVQLPSTEDELLPAPLVSGTKFSLKALLFAGAVAAALVAAAAFFFFRQTAPEAPRIVASTPTPTPTPAPTPVPTPAPPPEPIPEPPPAVLLQIFVRRPVAGPNDSVRFEDQAIPAGGVLSASERPGKGELLCQIGAALPPPGTPAELRWLRNGVLNDVVSLNLRPKNPRVAYGNRGDPGAYEVQLFYGGQVHHAVRFEIQ